jgi:hypothetical protein
MGNQLKVVGKTEHELRVANHIILFKTEGFDKDYHGQHFTPNTGLESSYTKTGRLLIDIEHGFEPDNVDGEPGVDDIVGYVDWKTAKVTDLGVWVERVLDRRNAYIAYTEPLIEAGFFGTSSEATKEWTFDEETGEIKSWPLKRDSMTVEPAEPRMMFSNMLAAVKSSIEIKNRQAQIEPDLLSDEEWGAFCDSLNNAIKAIKEVI